MKIKTKSMEELKAEFARKRDIVNKNSSVKIDIHEVEYDNRNMYESMIKWIDRIIEDDNSN